MEKEAVVNPELEQEAKVGIVDSIVDSYYVRKAKNAKVAEEKFTEAEPTVSESVEAGFANAPIIRQAIQLWDTSHMQREEGFDPTGYAYDYLDELGYDVVEKLFDTDSKEELDYYVEEFRKQKLNSQIANANLAGQVASFVGNTASMENILATIATAGTSTIGVVANSARQGMLANAIRGGIAGGVGGTLGSLVDEDTTIAFTEEDILWGALLGTGIGGASGALIGKNYVKQTAPTLDTSGLNDVGGALMKSAKHMYNRALGKGYTEWKDVHAAKAERIRKHREVTGEDGKIRTGIFDKGIDDMDMQAYLDPEADKEAMLADWRKRNEMDKRELNITTAEEAYDRIKGVQSEYAKGRLNNSPTAQMVNVLLNESGTASVVKTDSASMTMDMLQQSTSYMYNKAYRTNYHAYWKRRNGVAELSNAPYKDRLTGYGTASTNYFKQRREFNEEMYLYMNAQYNGKPLPKNVSPEVKMAVDETNKVNKRMYDYSYEANVDGYRDFDYKDGYINQRHESIYYQRARQKHGDETLNTVIQKALMSKYGANIQDADKALRVAKVFARRHLDKPRNIHASSIMDDESWEILGEALAKEGIDLSEVGGIRGAWSEGVNAKQADKGKTRFAKQRMPLDMEVEHNGLRMLDLINTDVEQLTANYAMSMSGVISLAQKGLRNKHDLDKLRTQILKEDPNLEQWFDDIVTTYTTGRIGGGVDNPYAARALKLAVLSYLNGLGFAQLAESGTSIATYGIANFFNTGSASMKKLFKGAKSPEIKQFADEINETIYPVAKEHLATPPHLVQELQSSSRLASTSVGDIVDSSINLAMTAQGYTSLFNSARSFQHNVAFNGLVQKIGRHIAKGTDIDEQLASLGMDRDLFKKIKANINSKGTKNADGTIDKLGLHSWDNETMDKFTYIVARNQNSIVQKAMAGESSAWMSKNFGSLLTQFRKFPIESVRKQLIRKGTIDQALLLQSASMNLAIGGTVITARNYINGGNTEVDLDTVLRNGITYNSDLGSLSMLWDMGISLSGAPKAMYINPYAIFNNGDLLSVPAVSAVNNALHLPASFAEAMLPFNDLEADNYRHIRGTPIIGNHFALSAMFQRPD